MPKKLTWKDILRQQIKNEHGFGWNVSEQSEKTKVVRRYEDDSRSSVMLPIEWRASNAREIADSIARLKDLMEDQNVLEPYLWPDHRHYANRLRTIPRHFLPDRYGKPNHPGA